MSSTFVFGPGSRPNIVAYLQATYPAHAQKAAAKSIVQRVVKRFETAGDSPHLDPFRDRRGENRRSPKRKNPAIVTLVDELLSEENMTAPKVVIKLRDIHNFRISKQTVHNIARDLCFRWTKSWHTPAHGFAYSHTKIKEENFFRELLRLTPTQLLNHMGY